jgi:cytochrome c5
MTIRVESAYEAHQVVQAAAAYLKENRGKGHCLVSCNCNACHSRKLLEQALPDIRQIADGEDHGQQR